MSRLAPLPLGDRFGKLVVYAESPRRLYGERAVVCRCDCGKDTTVRMTALRRGNTKSCGCHRLAVLARGPKASVTHGRTKTPEYVAWRSMRTRCFNLNRPEFKHYGGRGITVCAEWRNSFEAFLADVGLRPSPGHSIDRIDNDGHYEPGNVRWATVQQQGRNRRSTDLLTYQGQTRSLSAWAKRVGLRQGVLHQRLYRQGWDLNRALSTPSRHERSHR